MKRLSTIQLQVAMLVTVACLALSPIAVHVGAQTPGANPGTELPADPPPATNPPVTEPPVSQPPVTEPPVTEPPVTEPPVTEPPVTEPPVTEPPSTEPPVTEPPATEPPGDDEASETETPTSEVTEELDAKDDGTPEGEVDEDSEPATPTPTEVPDPVVTWSQPNPVDCRPSSAGFVGFDHMQSETYRCTALIEASGEPEIPEGMSIEWSLEASFTDQLHIQLPADSQGRVLSSTQLDGVDTRRMVVGMPWQNESSVQSIEFDLMVTRTVCEIGDNPITVQAVPTVENANADVEIRANGAAPERTIESAVFLPNLDTPSLTMQPLDFGRFEFDGESWGTSTVTGVITVSNDGCQTSQDFAIGIEVTSDSSGMMPVVISKSSNNASVVAHSNDSANGIATVTSGFTGEAQVDVDFQLTPQEVAEPGDHTMTIWLSIDAAP